VILTAFDLDFSKFDKSITPAQLRKDAKFIMHRQEWTGSVHDIIARGMGEMTQWDVRKRSRMKGTSFGLGSMFVYDLAAYLALNGATGHITSTRGDMVSTCTLQPPGFVMSARPFRADQEGEN
jgi:hypothetical protein